MKFKLLGILHVGKVVGLTEEQVQKILAGDCTCPVCSQVKAKVEEAKSPRERFLDQLRANYKNN